MEGVDEEARLGVARTHHEVPWEPDAVDLEPKSTTELGVDHTQQDGQPLLSLQHRVEQRVVWVVVGLAVALEPLFCEEVVVEVGDLHEQRGAGAAAHLLAGVPGAGEVVTQMVAEAAAALDRLR